MAKLAAIGLASLVATFVGSAQAADMPLPGSVGVPWSWTGFYVGAHVGGALERADLADPFGAAVFGDKVRSPAFIGGGQAGGNYQIGNVVIGAGADVSWANSSGDNTCFGIAGGQFFASNCSVHPDLFGTLTARLGYAFGRSLVYAKGGLAFEHNNVDFIVNNNPGLHVLTSANSYGATGWTAGGGIEYALSPAWSMMLEYDYLAFDSHDVATPYVAGNPLPGHPTGPVAGLSNNVQEIKLGLNYRLGAYPALWPALPAPVAALPLKAAPLAAYGWEIEAGTRYMYSRGRAQWDLGDTFNQPHNLLVSRLTWDDLTTNSAELYGRIDTPWNVFLSGFIGTGQTVSGGQNDEDFHIVSPAPARPYNNTFSTNDGHIGYALLDLGYDVLRSGDYKLAPFVGYTYFNQYIFKSGCQQIANTNGNCVVPVPSSQLIGLEDMRWQGLRVGLSGQVAPADRVKLTADVAYLPYVTFNWLDDHLGRDLQFQQWGQGIGVQAQVVLSYDVTDRLNVGIGARYWAMWADNAQVQTIETTGTGPVRPNRNAIELAGAFVQAGYRFAPGEPAAAKAAGPALLPVYKAAPAALAYDWTGFYLGAEGGAVWGQSKFIGQTAARDTFDATPSFDVTGGLFGVTAGYNSRFDRMWLFGLESDMSLVTAKGAAQQIPPFNINQTASTREDWLATARARLGFLPADRWLVYATGGLAAADVEASILPSVAFVSERHVRAGWTAGGGVEAAITGNVSAKLEYLHVGLENHAYFVPTPNIPNQTNRAGGVPLDNEIVRAGINFKVN